MLIETWGLLAREQAGRDGDVHHDRLLALGPRCRLLLLALRCWWRRVAVQLLHQSLALRAVEPLQAALQSFTRF
ncbi:MAG: hypothetical protein ACK4ZJ_16990, partial [Allorhizobium sp.]